MEDIKQSIKNLQNITRCFGNFEKLDLKKAEGLLEFEKLVKSLPSGEIIGKSLDEWRITAGVAIDKNMAARRENFGRFVAEFIRAQREAKTTVREFNNAWRVGSVEMQLRAEQASAQFTYNNEVLFKWFPIASGESLSKQFAEVKKQLEDAALPLEKLIDVFWAAYEFLKWKRVQRNDPNPHVVPAQDFYREVRVALARSSFDAKQPAKDLPKWAFLYNLDRYLSSSGQILQNKRIGTQAGSQHEVSSGKGIIINGLDANQDYKTICHIIA